MKIRGWFIEGFGPFRDHEIRDLPDGVTVFLGPNEAGKSSLLAFLRGTLFGFPDRRSKESQYPPLHGGRHGGRLFIEGAGGAHVVEREADRRRPPRVTLPGGTEGGEGDLRRLLGGVDERLFRSVFGFSLAELQTFDTLGAEGVRDRVFSAGIVGAGRSAREVVAKLEEQTSTLLKRQGAQARINDLVKELRDLQDRISEAKRLAEGYPDLVEEEKRPAAEAERLAREAEELRLSQERCKALLELWPVWHGLQGARKRLDELPAVDVFPPDAEARLASALGEVRAAASALVDLRNEQKDAERRRGELEVDDTLAAPAQEVEALAAELALHERRLADRGQVRVELANAERALRDRLQQLGPDWDEERVAAFDVSIPRREEVRAWAPRLEDARRAVDEARRRLDEAEHEAEECRNSLKALQANPPGDPPPEPAEVEERAGVLRRLRADLSEMERAGVQAEARDLLVQDRERAIRTLEQEMRWSPPRGLFAAAGLLAVALFALAAWRGVASDVPGAVGIALGGVFALVVLYTLRDLRAKAKLLDGQRQQNLVALRGELEDARRVRDERRNVARGMQGRVDEATREAGLEARPSAHDLEEALGLIPRQLDARRRWEDAARGLREAETALKDAEEGVGNLRTDLGRAQETEQRELEAWTAWKREQSLPENLGPEGVLNFLDRVERAREALEVGDGVRDRSSQLAAEVSAWEERAVAVVETTGGPPDLTGEALARHVRALRQMCEEDRAARAKLAGIEEEMAKRAPKLETAERRLADAEEARDRLFEEGAAEDEASFRERLATFKGRQELLRQAGDAEARIAARAGAGPEADAFRSELAKGTVETWQAGASRGQEVADLERQRDEWVERRQDARRKREELEVSADVAGLEGKRAQLLAELEDAARAWRVAALAKALVEHTLGEFQRTRQPEVLAHASGALGGITAGRYVRVVQEGTEGDLAVLDRRGGRKRLPELSQGTAEQLYLCLRLGLVAVFARQSGPVPLVMDDVLVNFDPRRAEAVARELTIFSRDHGVQVLLFTCHPATRDLLQEADPGVRCEELPDSDLPESEIQRIVGAAPAPDGPDGGPKDRELVLGSVSLDPRTIGQLAQQTGLDTARLRRTLQRLREEGRVVMVGQRRGARWALRQASAIGDGPIS